MVHFNGKRCRTERKLIEAKSIELLEKRPKGRRQLKNDQSESETIKRKPILRNHGNERKWISESEIDGKKLKIQQFFQSGRRNKMKLTVWSRCSTQYDNQWSDIFNLPRNGWICSWMEHFAMESGRFFPTNSLTHLWQMQCPIYFYLRVTLWSVEQKCGFKVSLVNEIFFKR